MMGNENTNQMNFFSEMSEYQITAREFFSTVLLDSLYRNFGFNDILSLILIPMAISCHGRTEAVH